MTRLVGSTSVFNSFSNRSMLAWAILSIPASAAPVGPVGANVLLTVNETSGGSARATPYAVADVSLKR